MTTSNEHQHDAPADTSATAPMPEAADTAATAPMPESPAPPAAGTGRTQPSAAAAHPTASMPPAAAPRVRWAGILWGVVFTAIGLAVIVVAGWPQQRAHFDAWTASIGWVGLGAVIVIAVGALVILLAALSGIKRAQLRRRAVR